MPDAAPAAKTPAGSTATRPSPVAASTVVALPARGTLLGFDFGLARIVAHDGDLVSVAVGAAARRQRILARLAQAQNLICSQSVCEVEDSSPHFSPTFGVCHPRIPWGHRKCGLQETRATWK